MQPRYLLAMFALAACGDDAGTTPVDSGTTVDASPDARPDAVPDANLGTPLVGTWVKSADAYVDQHYQSIAFRGDGTFTIVGPEDTTVGTYLVPRPGRLRLFFNGDFLESSFVTLNDQILFDAVLPQGPVTGVVGTWATTLELGIGTVTSTLTISANGTASATSMAPAGTATYTATWVAEGTGLAMVWDEQPDHTEHIRPLGALGIGPNLVTKQP